MFGAHPEMRIQTEPRCRRNAQSDKTSVLRSYRRLRTITHTQSSIQRLDMQLYRRFAQSEVASYLLVCLANGQRAQHSLLPVGQICGTLYLVMRCYRTSLSPWLDLQKLNGNKTFAQNHEANCVQKGHGAHGFVQKTLRTMLEGLRDNVALCDTGNQRNRRCIHHCKNLSQPLQSLHARHVVIQKHQIKPLGLLEDDDRLADISCRDDNDIRLLTQIRAQRIAQQFVIICNEEAHNSGQSFALGR